MTSEFGTPNPKEYEEFFIFFVEPAFIILVHVNLLGPAESIKFERTSRHRLLHASRF